MKRVSSDVAQARVVLRVVAAPVRCSLRCSVVASASRRGSVPFSKAKGGVQRRKKNTCCEVWKTLVWGGGSKRKGFGIFTAIR